MHDNTTKINIGTHKSPKYNDCIGDLFENSTIASTARKSPRGLKERIAFCFQSLGIIYFPILDCFKLVQFLFLIALFLILSTLVPFNGCLLFFCSYLLSMFQIYF